jgi:hypothetical protein
MNCSVGLASILFAYSVPDSYGGNGFNIFSLVCRTGFPVNV